MNKILNGLDTETIDGYCRIIAKPNSWKNVNSFEEIWEFIRGENYWTYNLRFDAEGILKYLPDDIIRDKVMEKKIEFQYDRFNIVYIPSKFLRISDTKNKHNSVRIYDLTSFCNFFSLNKACETFKIPLKHDNVTVRNFIKHQKDWNLEEYLKKGNNLKIIGDYCQDDADKVNKLGIIIMNLCKNIMGIEIHSPTSKAKITCEIIKKLKIPYPVGRWHPNRVAYWCAKMCYKGGMFETYKKGLFQNCIDVDIQSAYPDVMSEFENLLNGWIFKVTDEKKLRLFQYGWLFVEHSCPYFPVKHLVPNIGNYLLEGKEVTIRYPGQYTVVYPEGTRYDFITLSEYYWLKKWGYKVGFIMGYGWRKVKNDFPKPFAWIKELYEKRTKYPKKEFPIENSLIKIGMNGGYGKTVQKKGESELENFYYGSYITAETRIKILDFIHENNLFEQVIQIATDGILFIDDGRKLEGDFTKNKLGAWDMEKIDEAFILMNGISQVKKGNDTITKLRGFHIHDKDLIHLIQKNRYKDKFTVLIKDKVIHMSEAIRNHIKYTKEDINRFVKQEKIVYLNSDKKRKWKELKNFDELLENIHTSKPYDISEIKREIIINEARAIL